MLNTLHLIAFTVRNKQNVFVFTIFSAILDFIFKLIVRLSIKHISAVRDLTGASVMSHWNPVILPTSLGQIGNLDVTTIGPKYALTFHHVDMLTFFLLALT